MCSKSLTRSCGLAVLCKEVSWGQSNGASHRNQLYRPRVLRGRGFGSASAEGSRCAERGGRTKVPVIILRLAYLEDYVSQIPCLELIQSTQKKL